MMQTSTSKWTTILSSWVVGLLFAIIYALISLVNHVFFRTSYFDLGLYTNALYRYLHFEGALFTTGDHLDFLLIVLSPLTLIFGTYTLLIVQIAAVVWGGVGVRKYLKVYGESLSIAGQLHFYLFFGFFAAFAFDYHSNVVAAALVPHLLLYIREQKYGFALGYTIGILIAKENMSLWLFFVLTGYAMQQYWSKTDSNPTQIKRILLLAGLSIGYFLLAIGIIMPMYQTNGSYLQLHYDVLQSGWEVGKIFTAFFYNHTDDPQGDYVKLELYLCLLFSGGIFLIKKPAYAWMLIPIVAQKMLHNTPLFWGVGYQYNVEFAPVIVLAAFEEIAAWKNPKYQKWGSIAVLMSTLATTVHICDSPIAYIDKSAIRIYQKQHYQNLQLSVADVRSVLSQIPDTVAVAAQTVFTPHLSLRTSLLEYPHLSNEVQYICIELSPSNPYPVTQERWQAVYDSLLQTHLWQQVEKKGNVVLLKKIGE